MVKTNLNYQSGLNIPIFVQQTTFYVFHEWWITSPENNISNNHSIPYHWIHHFQPVSMIIVSPIPAINIIHHILINHSYK